MIKVLKQKKYYYDIFLAPLGLLRKIHVMSYKIKSMLFSHHGPHTLVVGLTYRCQLDCIHCGIKGYLINSGVELTTQEIMNVINQAHRLGVYQVNFAGGEPLLRNDIEVLVAYASKQGLIVSISTNGFILTQPKIRQLKRKGLTFVNVSIDSIIPEIHDDLRKSHGSFQKAKNAIISCVAEKISVFISTYLTKDHIRNGDVEKVIRFAKRLGVKGVKILLPILSGKWSERSDLLLSEEDKRYLSSFLKSNYVFIEGVCNKSTECNALTKKILYISPYGEVQPCTFVPLCFGNIREEPLRNIWERMTKHNLYKTIDTTDCIMRNKEFRNQYIKPIGVAQELPISIKQ